MQERPTYLLLALALSASPLLPGVATAQHKGTTAVVTANTMITGTTTSTAESTVMRPGWSTTTGQHHGTFQGTSRITA